MAISVIQIFMSSIICFTFKCQVDLRRAYNCEIMLSKIKIPLPDMMVSCLYSSCICMEFFLL